MQLTVSYIDQILVMLVFAFSLNLVLGYGGIFTAAHAAFGAIGGYGVVWLLTRYGLSVWPAALISVIVAGAFGLLVGYAALRLEMLWLLLLTLAVQLVLVGVLTGLDEFGGSSGLQTTSIRVFGHDLIEPTQVLPLVAVGAFVIFCLCYRMGESPFGRVLRGIREDETATRSLGKNVFLYKLSVFGITSTMAGFGGVLLSIQNGLASPSLFGFNVSVQVIAMVIIGGAGNLFGSVVGVSLVVLATPFFENVIHLSTSTASLAQQLAYGLALAAVIFLRPQGLIPEGTSLTNWGRALLRPRSIAPAIGGSPDATAGPQSARVNVLPMIDTPADLPVADVVVEVRDLSKAFGGIRAVDGLSMDLRRGQITALIGPNGAGKTTVFNLLTGALPVDAGHVHLNGADVTGMRPDVITRLGMARSFQDVRIFPALSVLDNVILGIRHQPGEYLRNLFGRPVLTAKAEKCAREQAHHWLRFIEMEGLARVRAGSLGFGQQKLVALARILATESNVLLLDEPGSGLDHSWLDEMIRIVQQVRDAGRTVCIVEHNLEVVGQLADHVYFMELGRVTAAGAFAELTSDPRLTEAYFGAV